MNFPGNNYQWISGRLRYHHTTGLITNTSSQWLIWIPNETGRGKADMETKQLLQVYA